MNKLTVFLNKIVGLKDGLFKLTLIICLITYLIIYYQSTLNNRYQYYPKTGNEHMLIFDTKKGEMYFWFPGKDNSPSQWFKVSPFSKSEVIPFE